ISPKAEVSGVTVNGAAGTFSKREEKLGASASLQRIVVNVPSTPPNGNLTVSVDYKLKVDENSGLNEISPMGAQFLPQSFWYPTPNSQFAARGADFAPFSLKVNSLQTVISSGSNNENDFEQKLNGQPFFVTGNWDQVQEKGVAVYLPKGAGAAEKQRAQELANLAVEAKTFVASLLGGITETPTRIVVVRRGAGFSDGGTILLNYGALQRQKIDSETAMTIAEAVAKTFLGNAAMVRGEGYGVIREGLSKFIAAQFLEKQFGKDAGEVERLRQRASFASVAERDAPLSRITPIDDFYYAAVADKGAMVWRTLAKMSGEQNFYNTLKTQMQTGNLTLANLRAAFPAQKDFLDYEFDQPTDMNLLVGLPQIIGGQAKAALRNLGAIDATVNVVATTDKGEKLTTRATIPKTSFGEAIFNTTSKIARVEVDAEKLYPQTNFSDDVAPREFNNSDVILVIKQAFDKQDFAGAEKNARIVLQSMPHFDDARTWLGRALLAQSKNAEADKEFRAVLSETLPSARSLAWANEGLGEIALKANQNSQAAQFFSEAIKADAEYGATLAARNGLDKAEPNPSVDETIKTFFAQFDKAATGGRKADLDALIVSGELPKFANGIGGVAPQWQTKVLRVDKIDDRDVLAETNLNIKLLNKEPESGTAVFRLSKIGNDWKLSGVEIFEVR
ncbi:MAG: hypothetical protein ACR2N3_00175, partial [Pyrinomonadaceae bacterium]